jgi:hypothetical protein
MPLTKLIQIKISCQMYDELIRETIMTGLSLSQICRLKLLNKKIIDKNDLEKENKQTFRRPVQIIGARTPYE